MTKTAEEIAAEAEAEEIAAANAKDDPPVEEDVITLGEEDEPPEEDSSVIKGFRTRHKAQKKEIAELREKLETTTAKPVEIGPKPTLEKCDFNNAEYENQINIWHEKKNEASRQKEKSEAEIKQRNDDWQKKLDVHGEKASALKVQDYEDKEDIVREMFDETQQGLIIDGATNSAVVVYALGKYPETAKVLAAIKNPVKFVAEMSRLEAKMNVSKRTPGTIPETKVKDSGGDLPAGESELDKLREEAAVSKDFSKVVAYKEKLRAAQNK